MKFLIISIARFLMYCIFPLKVHNKQYFPLGGMIICNHVSMLDPVAAVVLAKKETLRFVAKEELFQTRFTNWVYRMFGAFPVKRGARDLSAVKECIEVIQSGSRLCIYPEGTRGKPFGLQPFGTGAAFIALSTNVEVLPMYTTGFRVFRRTHVFFGEPLRLAAEGRVKINSALLKEATLQMEEAMRELQKQALSVKN